MTNRTRTNLAALFLIPLFVFSAFAQKPKPAATPIAAAEDDDGEVIRVNSRLVVVPVSVTDANGQPVTGLKAQDFRVSEESKPQEIAQVSDAEKVPLEIALLFDVSASTDAMFEFEQETAAKFLREVMRPEDRATIFTIGAEPLVIQARGAANEAANAVKTIKPTKQFTAFFDTVSIASEYLRKNTPTGRRKVIIVISDGEDTNSIRIRQALSYGYQKLGEKINTIDSKKLYELSRAFRDEANDREILRVLQVLQNADAVFYSVNPSGNSVKLNQVSVKGQSNLKRFADQTGGTAFLPNFQSVSLKDTLQNSYNQKFNQETLTRIFRQLANELQAQYLVQYYSDGEFPNDKYVNLDVDLQQQNAGKNRIRARKGYFVKN